MEDLCQALGQGSKGDDKGYWYARGKKKKKGRKRKKERKGKEEGMRRVRVIERSLERKKWKSWRRN